MKHLFLFIAAILSCVTGFAQGGYDPTNPGDPDPYRKLTLFASPKAGGSVSTDNNSGQVGVGQTVSCHASANKYYDFVHWLKNGEIVSTDPYFSFVMPDEDVEMVAVFVPDYNPESPADPDEVKPSHRVTFTADPGRGGRFSSSAFKLCEGDSVNVYAYPGEGFRFDEWLLDGVLVSTKNPLMVKMTDRDLHFTARFSYDPANPADPAANLFIPATGEMVIDRFEPGYLSSAVYSLLGDDYTYSDIISLTVCGMMDGSDFGSFYRMSGCSVLDLSRTNGFAEIPSYAFESMSSLTEVCLPSCINTIGRYAFQGCNNLSVINCHAVIPPALEYGALDGIDNSVVIKVPSQSMGLYMNADGWKNFTILPVDTDVFSISVILPGDASDGRYKNMGIELINVSNGQKYRYLITDKTEYIFGNLMSSTAYSVYVKNAKNEILGEISDLEIVDKDITAVFPSLRQPKNITVKVLTPEEMDVTSDVTVKWYGEDNELLQLGATLSGVLENSVVSCNVSLPQAMLQSYSQPAPQVITAGSQAILTCSLQALGKSTLKGKVTDNGGNPVYGVSVALSQKINGAYTSAQTVRCDNNGDFEIEVPDVPLKVTFSANGYIAQTKELESPSTPLGDIILEKNTGITIYPSYSFKSSVAADEVPQEADWYSDDANIAYRIEDAGGNEITDCIYQHGSIVLPESFQLGDEVKVVAYSKNNRFADVAQPLAVESKVNYIELQIVEYGGVCISLGEDAAKGICLLYDASGKQVGKSSLRDNSVTFGNLPDGKYTVISMQKSSMLGSVSSLSSFMETGLAQGSDYLLDEVNVVSGQLSQLSIPQIPALDESKLYYTDSKETYFMSNKSQLTVGSYVTLKARATLKDEYAQVIDAATLIVDIPAGCEFVDNSVISGAGYLGYEFADNRLSVPLRNLGDVVRFCVVPVEGGDCMPSAFVKLVIDNREILQPIGSAFFKAKNFSLATPKKSSTTSIAVRGTATADSEVLVYDNETLVGSTYSMPDGQWSLKLNLHKPYSKSIHNLYGEVVTPDGKRLLTQTQTVDYDQGYVDLAKVTMAYNNTNIVFDHLNGHKTANSYSYVPGTTDFTFIADFTENNPEKIANVIIKVLASDGSVRTLPADYNPASRNWVVRTKYSDSNKLPVNATAEFDVLSDMSIYNINIDNDDQCLFNDMSDKILNSYINGEINVLAELDNYQLVSIIPQGEDTNEYIGMERLDYDRLKEDLQGFKTYIFKDDGYNIEFLDSLINETYVFYWLDHNNHNAFELKYSVKELINSSGQQRILPVFVASVAGGLVGSIIYRGKHQGIIDFWRRQLEYDKDLIQKKHTELVTALYAECEDGSLKIKDSFNFQVDEQLVDNWANESLIFLSIYRRKVDYLEQFFNCRALASNLLNIGVSILTEGLSAYIPPVSQVTSAIIDGAIAEISAIGGNKVDNNVKTPLEEICKWYDEEAPKLSRKCIEVFECIKSAYSDCEKKEDEDDGDDDFPAPPTTPSIDPSGYVYEAVPSNRIPGVTATAYFRQQSEDMYGDITETAVVWDAEPFGQENPLLTDEKGMYAWDVPAGMWQVRFEKEGYEAAQSEWLPVPPPQLDVNIAITQAKQPEVKSVHAYSDGVAIEFDKFMLPASLTVGNIILTQGGSVIDADVEAIDIELDAKGAAFCSKIEVKPRKQLADGEVTLFVSKAVKSYANIGMSEDFMQTFTIEPRISEISVDKNVNIHSGMTMTLSASLIPAAAASGKTVVIESLNPIIASALSGKAVADEHGNITFDVCGIITGTTAIRLSVEDYDLEALVNVNVLPQLVANQVATPYASVESGGIKSGTEVYLYCDTENATIYYTMDGSCPCDVGRHRYDGNPLVIEEDCTLKLMAEADGMIESEIAEYHYSVIQVGIVDIQDGNDIAIYPLPLGEYLNVSNGDYPIESVAIYSLSGDLMAHSGKSERQITMKVGFLNPGIYILNVKSNGQSVVKKVIKN